MFNCKVCKHEDMMHVIFAGCCGVTDCPCESMDGGKSSCMKEEHGSACWWAPKKTPNPNIIKYSTQAERMAAKRARKEERERIIDMLRTVGQIDAVKTIQVDAHLKGGRVADEKDLG